MERAELYGAMVYVRETLYARSCLHFRGLTSLGDLYSWIWQNSLDVCAVSFYM